MRPSSLSRPAVVLTVHRPTEPTTAAALRPGNLVSARVVEFTPGGLVRLELAGRLVQARTEMSLLPGQVLKLRVESDGPRLLLRLVSTPEAERRLAALRTVLPRQQPLAQALMEAIRTAQIPEFRRPAVRPLVRNALQDLTGAIPQARQLATPEGLARAIRASGVFLEARLARGTRGEQTAALSQDFKAVLLRTLGQLARPVATGSATPSPPTEADMRESQTPAASPVRPGAAPADAAPRQTPVPAMWLQGLTRPLEAALARVQTLQLHNSVQAERREEPPQWNLEIPVRHDGNAVEAVAVEIRREAARQRREAADLWSVTLDLPGGEQGAIHAVVTLDRGEVSVMFQLEKETTAERFCERLDHLRERLAEQGLAVGQTHARPGLQPNAEPWQHRVAGLLSERA